MHAEKNNPEPLMNREEAAKYLGITPGTLAVWDSTKRYNLGTIKVGRRLVRYRRSDLDRFLEEWKPLRPG